MELSLNRKGRLFLVATILITLISVSIRVPPLILLASMMAAYIISYPILKRNTDLPKVEVHANLRHNVLFRGEVDILQVRVTNYSPNPIPLVELVINLPNSFFILDQATNYKFTLEPEFTVTLNIPIVASTRGYHSLGPFEVKIKDPLQIYEQIIASQEELKLRTYPRRLAKQVPYGRAKRVFSKIVGFFAIQMRGMGTDFHGLREYIRGDPSKVVDWKATARSNKLISREYEDEQKLEIIIALDAGATMRGTKFEYVLGMGMEVYKGFLDLGKPVGLVIFNDSIVQQYMPSISTTRMNKIWASIYGLHPKDTYSDYFQLDKWIDKNGITRTLIIVLGDLEADFKEISNVVRNIKLRGNQIIFIDIWGFSFSYENAIEEVTKNTEQQQYGQILKNIIGGGLKQNNIFRGLEIKQDMTRYSAIYGFVEDSKENVIDALDRAMYSHFGSAWKSGN